jgi:probable addiction module antidote protein
MPLETEPYDVVDYLASPEDIASYLQVTLEEGDVSEIASALDDAIRAKGFAKFAEETGIPYRDAIRALNIDNRTNLDGLLKLIEALGVKTSVRQAA